MKPTHELAVATAPRKDSKTWKMGTVTWGKVLDWLANPADTKECGNYLLGVLNGPRRKNTTLVTRSALTLDVDYPERGFLDTLEMLLPCAVAAHTTFNSAPDAPRYRLIIPLDREATPEEYEGLAVVLMRLLGEEQFDPSTTEPARYMFKPSAQNPGWYEHRVIDGDPLQVDSTLAGWSGELPAPTPKVHPNKRDPLTLEGTLGAFNRAYEDLALLVQEYDLPYEQHAEDRWHLAGARSVAGMGPVAPGLYFSHHVKDPAWGQTCSAFDLVRLHRFADLDDAARDNTPVNRLPSHQAMLELASRDHRVVAELVGVDFSDDMDAQANDWRLGLQLNPRDGLFRDIIQNWDLVVANDPAFAGLHFNEMSLAVETSTDLPWRSLDQGGELFTATDRAALCHYLERQYNLRPSRTLVDELVNVRAQQRVHHPVREYLNALRWDGTPRVETCLPGVTPNEYTRMVARKGMVAAVARVMDPGCKWDHTLVLYGPEGMGKSWWIDRMFKGHSDTLGAIRDKDTLLAMQRAWVMIADEGHSLRKADADVQKEFLTRTKDVFRMPYDREVMPHPRHCVIWSTTNDEVFLRRQEGNRRFLIVRSEAEVDFAALTDEYIDQVWAEATHLYRLGEPLYLDKESGRQAAVEREQFTEEDALGGIIQTYLDTLVPSEWDEMNPDARRVWLQNRADGLVARGTRQITQVCTAQVWEEALGRRRGEHRRADLLDINAALKRLPGWVAMKGNRRVPGYGTQHVYEREDIL